MTVDLNVLKQKDLKIKQVQHKEIEALYSRIDFFVLMLYSAKFVVSMNKFEQDQQNLTLNKRLSEKR